MKPVFISALSFIMVFSMLMLCGCGISNSYERKEETEDFVAHEIIAEIGGSSSMLRKQLPQALIISHANFFAWKCPNRYMVACSDSGIISSIASFSNDLELIEEKGIKTIEDLNPIELTGLSEDDFEKQYGSCHFKAGLSQDVPCYISNTGKIYYLFYENGVIQSLVEIDLTGKQAVTVLFTLGKPSLDDTESDTQQAKMDDNETMLQVDCRSAFDLAGGQFAGDTVTIHGNKKKTTEDLNPMALIGKSEDVIVAKYGAPHFDAGSGFYIPCYISKTGKEYSLFIENGLVCSVCVVDLFSYDSVYIIAVSKDDALLMQ